MIFPAPQSDAPHLLVLGGGLAGAAAATLVARAGQQVTLIEQHALPHHKVCGEFLSGEALRYLGALGLPRQFLTRRLGAVPITHVRLAHGTHVAVAALPFPALSLTRRSLDEALLGLARNAGVQLLRGHPVDALRYAASAWQATLRSGEVLRAPHAFLATGKHDLRAFPRPPGRQNHLVAFKQYFTLLPAEAATLDRHVELHLFPGGYAGLQPVEPDPDTDQPRANLCLVVDAVHYRQIGATWHLLLAHLTAHSPHLAQRLAGATELLPKPLALARIPYGLLLRDAHPAAMHDPESTDTLWRLGDQTAVIPSFTGDGMSLALHTAFLASQLFLCGQTAPHLTTRLHQTLHRQITRATSVSQLLLTPFASPLATLATPILPTLLRHLARSTRIPPGALLHHPPAATLPT